MDHPSDAWLVAGVVLGVGCGRSEIWVPELPPPPPLRCAEPVDVLSTSGCSFVAAPGVHLSDVLTDRLDVDPSLRDSDGVLVVNPDPVASVRLQLTEHLAGGEVRPLGGTQTLAPGDARMIELPPTEPRESSGMRRQGLVRIMGDAPFVASLHTPYRSFLGNDSGLLLPEARWGQRYVVAAYTPHSAQFQGVGEPTYFEIVAREDDTRVRWLPRGAATAGDDDRVPAADAGEWSPELWLDAHESVLVTAVMGPGDPRSRDVTGTVIEASAPIGVTSGSRCSAVPASSEPGEGCDPLLEQLVPVEQWGQIAVVPRSPLRTSESHHYRVLAGAAGVTVRSDPSVLPSEPYLLAALGDYVDIVVPHGTSFVLEADGPMQVVGYLQTRDYDVEIGDPAMYQLPPVEQFLTHTVVGTGVQWDVHFLQLVRRAGGAPVRIDGDEVVGWVGVGAGAYEAAEVVVGEGRHVVDGATPFGVVQIGWTNSVHPACLAYSTHGTCQTSYAQLGGVGTRSLQPL